MGEPEGEGKGERMNKQGKNEKGKGGEKKMREEKERNWIPIEASNWI